MAEDRSRAIKMEIGEGGMRISSECCGSGEAGETVPIAYEGDRITAGFNATYLNDFFHAIEEGLVDPGRMIQIGIRSPVQVEVAAWAASVDPAMPQY